MHFWYRKNDIITTVSFRVSLDETRGASDTPPFAAGRRKASPVAAAGHSTRRRTTRATTVEDASDLQGFGRANTWESLGHSKSRRRQHSYTRA